MTNSTNENTPKKGMGKSGAGLVSAIAAYYLTAFLEKHYGTAFAEAGISEEILKPMVLGTAVSFFVWLTPQNFVEWVKDIILFVRNAFKEWRNAVNNGE